MTAKVSVSLSDDDLTYIDGRARSQGGSRSAVIHDLVRISRELEATSDYVAAFREWEESGEAELWEGTASDGISA